MLNPIFLIVVLRPLRINSKEKSNKLVTFPIQIQSVRSSKVQLTSYSTMKLDGTSNLHMLIAMLVIPSSSPNQTVISNANQSNVVSNLWIHQITVEDCKELWLDQIFQKINTLVEHFQLISQQLF